MDEDEILATGFAHKAGIGDIFVEVVACQLPQTFECLGGTREVDASEILRLCGGLADEHSAAGKEVYYTVG